MATLFPRTCVIFFLRGNVELSIRPNFEFKKIHLLLSVRVFLLGITEIGMHVTNTVAVCEIPVISVCLSLFVWTNKVWYRGVFTTPPLFFFEKKNIVKFSKFLSSSPFGYYILDILISNLTIPQFFVRFGIWICYIQIAAIYWNIHIVKKKKKCYNYDFNYDI